VRAIAGVTHDRHDLLDRRRIGRIAHTLVARRPTAVMTGQRRHRPPPTRSIQQHHRPHDRPPTSRTHRPSHDTDPSDDNARTFNAAARTVDERNSDPRALQLLQESGCEMAPIRNVACSLDDRSVPMAAALDSVSVMSNAYITLWSQPQIEVQRRHLLDDDDTLSHTANDQFRAVRVAAGDRVYVVGTREGQLLLLDASRSSAWWIKARLIVISAGRCTRPWTISSVRERGCA
jgi:hypothetical protein